ncbi:MAG: hypothetical protein LBM97_01120 [Candidatus Nomurabacteria bacterium]|nr:hypothetical protein [Candidatus Nomurabacteria bacterium]
MKRIKLLSIIPMVLGLFISLAFSPFSANTYAASGDCPETSIIGKDEADFCNAQGGGIWYILNLALRILTWGVGIVAVLGVIIAAIIYTTAGGDDGKVKLAKTMIFNIAIGLVLYVLLYAILNFILPNQINSSGDGNTPLVQPGSNP